TVLQSLSTERLMDTTLRLAPAARLLRSPWPGYSIWRFNMEPGAPKPTMAAEDVLVLRPELDPEPHLLPSGGGAFLAALRKGQRFGEALASAHQENDAFDLAATLTLLIAGGAIQHIGEK
ncbi:MAG: DUF2063 domain-containing protein, partial [Myxococcota bacterium]